MNIIVITTTGYEGMMSEECFMDCAEHVEMETSYYGNPNTLIISNSTQDWYAETFVDVRTAQQYDSCDHARSAY